MRINKTYHITLPDVIVKEIKELQDINPMLQNRSNVIAYAVHNLYLTTIGKESHSEVSRGKGPCPDTP